MLIQMYAQPFSGGGGFYFENAAQFDEGMEKLGRRGIEEVEIQVIDGEGWAVDLANAANPSQGEVHTVLDLIDECFVARDEKRTAAAAFFALTHLNESLKAVAKRNLEDFADDAMIRCDMTLKDVAEEYLAEGLVADDAYETYFDWAAFGRDIRDDVVSMAVEQARDEAEDEEAADKAEEAVYDTYERMSDTAIAEEYVDSCGSLTDCLPRAGSGKRGRHGPTLEDYFDVEAFARDLDINGDVVEFEFDGDTCCAMNANGV